ncbi:hypothetical protein QBC40DRAFT_317773 [Triangularia verruculosa]|uniref:Uncharacterized protein n=1 Tax=Triangularia verruculosa TaxID=2587418 RepID=A0AAN7AN64_9PEZI|nr:hypothetical protein QBC40DRAFT_317773 [Triangularia verruculosa]
MATNQEDSNKFTTVDNLKRFLTSLLPDTEDSKGFVWEPCRAQHSHEICERYPRACARERLIQLAANASGRPYDSFASWRSASMDCTHVWAKTVFRIALYEKPFVGTIYQSAIDCQGDLDRPAPSLKLLSEIRSQYRARQPKGRSQNIFLTGKVIFLADLEKRLIEELGAAMESLDDLRQIVGLLRALHNYAKERIHKKVRGLEMDESMLKKVRLMMMMEDRGSDTRANRVVGPFMERNKSEWETLHDNKVFKEHERTCLWLESHVIKPLEEALKEWDRIIRVYGRKLKEVRGLKRRCWEMRQKAARESRCDDPLMIFHEASFMFRTVNIVSPRPPEL